MQLKHKISPQTIKQWWHETYILPSELRELVTPNTCSLAPKIMFLVQCPPNNKTTIEHKASNLPNGVTKGRWLMTPQTGCGHTHIHANNYLWKGNFSEWKTFTVLRPENIFPKCYDSPGLTI